MSHPNPTHLPDPHFQKQNRFFWLLLSVSLFSLALLAAACRGLGQPGIPVNTPISLLPIPTATLVVVLPPTQALSTPSPTAPGAIPSTPTPTVVLPQPDPWDGKGRVTLLLLGLDYADWESTDRVGPPRSDTMLLLTVDPVGKTAGMLSIPRDLWVSLPGFEGEYKINTAHRFGEIYQVPGGGPGLAMRTVEGLLGVPVNYYARVDFKAFEDFIDELGGIELDIASQIKVDPTGPGNTVVLEPGRQTLDGATALAYARNRYTANDDFDRSERQQQVILAVRQKALQPGSLARLIARAPAIYQKLSSGIQTNLTLQQIIKLAWLAQEIPAENIARHQIGSDAVTYATSPEGESIYVPIPSRIQALRDEIFTSSIAGQGSMTNQELVSAESVRIRLIDQTGEADLGKRTAEYLEAQGLDVIETVESQETRPLTRLVDLASNPYTLRSLIDLLQVSPSEIYISLDLSQEAEMLVYLGEDWAQIKLLSP
jgi:polyisoprenyl-teichoic acid--peptidoglycan teichoic acid transferase